MSEDKKVESVKIYSSRPTTLILDTQAKMKRAVVTVSRSFSLYKMKSLIKKLRQISHFMTRLLKC